MAIINNNVQNVKFLRNAALYESREAARAALEANKALGADGTALLARYSGETATDVKTLVGLVWSDRTNYTVTIIDVEGGSSDVQELREEINAKLGEGVTSANTVTDQLGALSGGTFTPGTSSSADTSVEGAKAYAYDLVGTLDGGVTAATGSYVASVTEVDGKISGTTAELPTVDDAAVAKKFVIAVDETNGEIEVSRGEITSSAKTIVLNDNADGGVDFDVNIDGTSIVKDANGVLSVASTALTQYSGDSVTIDVSAADANNNKTISSLLTIEEVTTSVPDTVAHRFQLAGSDHVKIGEYIDIPKDSALADFYLGHVDDELTDADPTTHESPTSAVTPGTGDAALVWIMQLSNGNYKLTAVNVESFLEESEFASGVTADSQTHIVHGVVDPNTEVDSNGDAFLTVGADGFKVDGIKDEIDKKLGDIVGDLDANVTAATSGNHVTITIDEVDGKLTQSGLTITESNIANADDLAELSGKTITDINSANGSITVTPANAADGTKEIDLATDASKIKMSGFTADTTDTTFSAITTNSSVAEAANVIVKEIIDNEAVVAQSLNDLRTDIDTVSGDVDTIKAQYVSGVSVNGNAVTVANHVAPISIESSTSAMTATSTEAIVVDTDANGNITLGLANIDCGTY